MYQTIVLGLGFLLLVGGGYLIKSVDSENVLSSSISKKTVLNTVLPASEDMAGVFTCDQLSGCDNNYTIIITPSGEAKMSAMSINGAEILNEQGKWNFERGGLISIAFDSSIYETYEIPHVFLVQSFSTTTLSKISLDTNIYKDMHKPFFKKIGAQ